MCIRGLFEEVCHLVGLLQFELISSSFCRKTTMVKHQRRSHQRGIHSLELDDGETSDSDSGTSPSTPQQSGQVQWPQSMAVLTRSTGQQRPHMQRAHSFADFGQQQMDGYPIQQNYNHRHSLSGGTQTFSNQSIPEEPHQNPLMQRAPNLPLNASYYVPEQNNPGVATLNTNPPSLQTYHIPRHQEILESSPSSYSSVSRASPVSQEPYYGHPAQAANYVLQDSSPVDQQPVVQFQHLPHHLTQQHSSSATPVPPVQEHFQPTAPQDGQWYNSIAGYQAQVEASNIQAYHQAQVFHYPWIQKIETFDDPSLQMPSARIENL